METKLDRIAKIAKFNPEERFTSLIHLINKETLIQCHEEMNGKKASGADEVTKEMYDEKLEENVEGLCRACHQLINHHDLTTQRAMKMV